MKNAPVTAEALRQKYAGASDYRSYLPAPEESRELAFIGVWALGVMCGLVVAMF